MSTEATQVMQNGQDNPASDVANLIAHLTNSAGVNGNGPIEQMLARMPPHESASVTLDIDRLLDAPSMHVVCSESSSSNPSSVILGRRCKWSVFMMFRRSLKAVNFVTRDLQSEAQVVQSYDICGEDNVSDDDAACSTSNNWPRP